MLSHDCVKSCSLPYCNFHHWTFGFSLLWGPLLLEFCVNVLAACIWCNFSQQLYSNFKTLGGGLAGSRWVKNTVIPTLLAVQWLVVFLLLRLMQSQRSLLSYWWFGTYKSSQYNSLKCSIKPPGAYLFQAHLGDYICIVQGFLQPFFIHLRDPNPAGE